MENASIEEAGTIQMESSVESERGKAVAGDCRIVTFFLAGKGYAFDIMHVKEIVKAEHFTFVPNTAPFVLGVYNLRGDIIPIIDLRLFFNLSVAEKRSDSLENMIVLTIDDQNYGVVVDNISKVASIFSSTIQQPHPIFGDINIRYIQGVVENQGRLYVLLDADTIFRQKELNDEHDVSISRKVFVEPQEKVSRVSEAENSDLDVGKSSVQDEVVPSFSAEQELSFIRDSLVALSRFYASQVNENWIKERFEQWRSIRGDENLQLHTPADAELFLSTFRSPCTDILWSDSYLDDVSSLLPDNSSRQINVWNIGCGKGFEAYSIAVMMKERYPNARIRVYAHDMDLLSISSAPLLTIPGIDVPSIMKSYITQNVAGEHVFTQEIKDMILFEYHDCSHQNSLAAIDFVVCRDVLSFMDSKKQSSIIYDISENLKAGGVVLLGANESMPKNAGWIKKIKGSVSVFTRE